ncbi:hypothetical protein ACPSM1_24690 [Micromonospora chersina]|uniref:hypothetical protein n=1 Tax=Micromonospora chersina TaxID=47854 RepID=UPI003CA52C46
MEPLDAELEVIDLTFVGLFHPGLLQPAWLARQGLISESEADEADISVITNDLSQFSTEWFTLEVIAERLRVVTQLSAFRLALRDLAVGLTAFMPAVEVKAFGINHSAHFGLGDEQTFHKLGHALAPKDVWSKIVAEPGTLTLQIIGTRSDERRGSHTYTLQPSKTVENAVFLASNDHYDITSESAAESATAASALLSDVFEESIERSHSYFAEILSYANDLRRGDASGD